MKPRWTFPNIIVVHSFMTEGKSTHQIHFGWRATKEQVGMLALKGKCI